MKKRYFILPALLLFLVVGVGYCGPFGFRRNSTNCANGSCAVAPTTHTTIVQTKQPVVVTEPIQVTNSLIEVPVKEEKVTNDICVTTKVEEKVEKKIEKKVAVPQKVVYNNSMRSNCQSNYSSNNYKANRPVLNRTGRFLSRLRFWR